MLELTELAELGALPLPGGVLDQTQCFLDALRMVKSDKAYWKAKLEPSWPNES